MVRCGEKNQEVEPNAFKMRLLSKVSLSMGTDGFAAYHSGGRDAVAHWLIRENVLASSHGHYLRNATFIFEPWM
jgi:hypothetical protein